MAIRIEQAGDVAVVVTEGIFTGGAETDELEASLREVIEKPGQRKILLNLSGTRLMLSLAIGVLMAAHLSAASRGIHFNSYLENGIEVTIARNYLGGFDREGIKFEDYVTGSHVLIENNRIVGGGLDDDFDWED